MVRLRKGLYDFGQRLRPAELRISAEFRTPKLAGNFTDIYKGDNFQFKISLTLELTSIKDY